VLNSQKNVYDLFHDLEVAMNTDPSPYWLLVYKLDENFYSAVNLKDEHDIIEYCLQNNWFSLCVVNPADLMMAINHPMPHIICEGLHEFATLHRPNPAEINLSDFCPPIKEGQNPNITNDEKQDSVPSPKDSGVESEGNSSAPPIAPENKKKDTTVLLDQIVATHPIAIGTEDNSQDDNPFICKLYLDEDEDYICDGCGHRLSGKIYRSLEYLRDQITGQYVYAPDNICPECATNEDKYLITDRHVKW